MNLEKIYYVCACIWRTEINFIENLIKTVGCNKGGRCATRGGLG